MSDESVPTLREIVDPSTVDSTTSPAAMGGNGGGGDVSQQLPDETAQALMENPDLIKKIVDSLTMELTKKIGDNVISAIEDLVPKHVKRAIRNAPR